jgi:hypothetical protein
MADGEAVLEDITGSRSSTTTAIATTSGSLASGATVSGGGEATSEPKLLRKGTTVMVQARTWCV